MSLNFTRKFSDYLGESNKTYEVQIKLANVHMEDDIEEVIESIISKLDIVESTGYSETPVITSHPSFPNLGPTFVTHCKYVVKYPSTNDEIRRHLNHALRMDETNLHLVVDVHARATPAVIHEEDDSEYVPRVSHEIQDDEIPETDPEVVEVAEYEHPEHFKLNKYDMNKETSGFERDIATYDEERDSVESSYTARPNAPEGISLFSSVDNPDPGA